MKHRDNGQQVEETGPTGEDKGNRCKEPWHGKYYKYIFSLSPLPSKMAHLVNLAILFCKPRDLNKTHIQLLKKFILFYIYTAIMSNTFTLYLQLTW